jgi:hypothetical protein
MYIAAIAFEHLSNFVLGLALCLVNLRDRFTQDLAETV